MNADTTNKDVHFMCGYCLIGDAAIRLMLKQFIWALDPERLPPSPIELFVQGMHQMWEQSDDEERPGPG